MFRASFFSLLLSSQYLSQNKSSQFETGAREGEKKSGKDLTKSQQCAKFVSERKVGKKGRLKIENPDGKANIIIIIVKTNKLP